MFFFSPLFNSMTSVCQGVSLYERESVSIIEFPPPEARFLLVSTVMSAV